MGTLWSELAPIADQVSDAPRVYADANLPAGLVSFMRTRLGWDVFFVLEHPHLRRARDIEHFRLARQLSRTLITLDRDYLDEHAFPSAETAGVLVISAPDERGLAKVVARFDRFIFRSHDAPGGPLPLDGRKLHAHIDWKQDETVDQ